MRIEGFRAPTPAAIVRPAYALALAFLIGTTGIAAAQELPPGYGTAMPTGSKITTTMSSGVDVDDYVFDGYVGQKADVSLKISKKQAMNASLVLVRPDGTEVSADDANAKFKFGKSITVLVPVQDPETGIVTPTPMQVPQVLKIKFTLDQIGTWKARILIPDTTRPPSESGEYTIAVKYGKPPKIKLKSPAPTLPTAFQFVIGANAGASIKFDFKFKSGNAVFNGLRAPNGEFVVVDVNLLKTKDDKFVKGNKIVIPDDFPRGDYELAFTVDEGVVLTKTNFSASVKLAKGAKKLKGKLDGNEPGISASGIAPAVGGPPNPAFGNILGTQVSLDVVNAIDSNDPNGDPVVLLGTVPLSAVVITPGASTTNIRGRVPKDAPSGTVDVVVRTSRGQVAVLENAFQVVPPPKSFVIDPIVGTGAGGFEVTITGENFPDEKTQIGVLIDGSDVPFPVMSATRTSVTFRIPSISEGFVGRPPGLATFAVRDLRSQLIGSLPIDSFEFLSSPGISRVTPGLVPILGGDQMFVKGTNFDATDDVFLETAVPGVYEQVVSTFIDVSLHTYVAPIRPKGTYKVYIEDEDGIQTARRTVSYFQFADFTTDTGLDNPPEFDVRDAWTTALSDFDGDGDEDLFLAKQGVGGRGTTALIQVFVNDGTGNLTDESSFRIPAPSATDDWRADRIWLADVTQDKFPDILITTNSTSVPASNRSHTRILVSTRRASGSDVGDRVFVDRTLDLMAPPRSGKSGVSNTDGDNWRGLDMWVGDVDLGPAGPPEILITHKDVKEEQNVFCGNYCNTSTTGGYTYGFYWGGSREFVWDSRARSGQGQYKFEHNFFPRKAGVTVSIANPPPGVIIPTCNGGNCRGTFTPFTGHSITAVDLDADRRPDVIVLSDEVVTKNGTPTSSTQVGLHFFNANEGSLITDVTAKIKALGGVTTGDTLAVGRFGFPDGSSFGTIVVAQAEAPANGTRAIRLFKFIPSIVEDDPGDFEDVTDKTIPSASFGEAWQASAMAVLDVDTDGDQDLVLVANAAPSLGVPAIRILRNVIEDSQVGVMRDEFAELIERVAGGGLDPFDGTSLLVGDLDGDGAAEYIVTRSVVDVDDEEATQTRTMTTDQ